MFCYITLHYKHKASSRNRRAYSRIWSL